MKSLPRAGFGHHPLPTRWLLLLCASLLAAATAAACSATADGETFGDPTGGTGANSGQGGSGQGAGSTLVGGSSAGGNVGCQNTCSADLKKIVDCNGVIVQECSGDQGCAGGECIDDPCEAADASKSSYGCNYWSLKTDLI
ncbi:MAG: hypothetical protein WKG00_28615, partial [Polyangiaceae bacterium]